MQNHLNQTNGEVVYSIREAAELLKRRYHTIYRYVVDGKLKVVSGMGRAMITSSELNRFLAKTSTYQPKKRIRKPREVAAERAPARSV